MCHATGRGKLVYTAPLVKERWQGISTVVSLDPINKISSKIIGLVYKCFQNFTKYFPIRS